MSYNCSHILPDIKTECDDGKDFALAQFARNISTADFSALKIMLRDYEEKEYYEHCAIIKQEIDFRVELAAKGWTS